MMSADCSSSSRGEVLVFPDAGAACQAAAAWLAEVIERVRRERGHAVLGLPTGSTPTAVYAELVDRHRAGAFIRGRHDVQPRRILSGQSA